MVANPLAGFKALVNIASVTTAGTNLVLTDAGDHATFTVPLADIHRYLDRAVAPAVQTSIDNGVTWSSTLASNTYTLRNLTAQVVLNTPLSGGTTYKVRLATFNYYPYTQIAQATDITATLTTPMMDVTVLQGSAGAGYISVIPGLTGGVFACKSWQLATGATIYTGYLTGRTLIILSFVDPNGTNAIESYVYCSDSNIQSSITTPSAEDLTFRCDSVIALI